MRFEDALKELRNGKKIRHPLFEEDEYLVGCFVGIKFIEESFEEMAARGMSITKMKGDLLHKDMTQRLSFLETVDLCEKYPFLQDRIINPQLNLLLVMSDDWEIYSENEE